eukprot:gnl/Hemi2/9299_TR3240_c0_g2_i1.p1 gnl/Hemi2/9299_TR3240_c0_g2~~gnl/Hemi2/9299_TR3240_c0_g2_i1.p1  ORF type:complete len:316 (-),score=48.65 gnl/Hemi2/9299_TR3240_c0_g2_i1:369-1316(-)
MPERGKPLVGVGFGVVRVAVVFALLLAVAQGDWYTIQEALVAAGDVYEEPDFITKKYSADDRTVVVDTASDIQFFVTQDLHSQQIAVRGSFTVLNWLQDAYLPLVKSSKYDLKAAIHQGFLIGAEAIFERIKELGASKKLVLQKELQTSLIGHSLGGAVATVLGMLLLEDGFDPANILIYTYGAPRVTDRCGAAAYADLPLLRVKNEADIVTMVPPSPPFFHIGWALFCTTTPPMPGWKTWNRLRATTRRGKPSPQVSQTWMKTRKSNPTLGSTSSLPTRRTSPLALLPQFHEPTCGPERRIATTALCMPKCWTP